MQTTDNLEFIDFDKYDESDLDEIIPTKSSYKISCRNTIRYYYFPYEDVLGCTKVLRSTVECTYRVTHGTFSPTDDSDWDYLGYTDLVSWDVLSVENNEGDEVDPEKVLTEGQFLEYSEGLTDFIGD